MDIVTDAEALAAEVEAARVQLKELLAAQQVIADGKLALSMFLLDRPDSEQQTTCCAQEANEEEQALEEQIIYLKALIASYDSQQAASSIAAEEEANNRLSMALATCLGAREAWDAHVSMHDARFARAISVCDSEEWEEDGDLMEQPLQMPPRPVSPGTCNQYTWQCGPCPGPCTGSKHTDVLSVWFSSSQSTPAPCMCECHHEHLAMPARYRLIAAERAKPLRRSFALLYHCGGHLHCYLQT